MDKQPDRQTGDETRPEEEGLERQQRATPEQVQEEEALRAKRRRRDIFDRLHAANIDLNDIVDILTPLMMPRIIKAIEETTAKKTDNPFGGSEL